MWQHGNHRPPADSKGAIHWFGREFCRSLTHLAAEAPPPLFIRDES